MEKDAVIVKRLARKIILISKDNKNYELIENKNYRLNVIAVIGPAVCEGKIFGEALLTEIGISRTRPYSAALGINKTKEQSHVPQRRKTNLLTEKQYLLIAPALFDLIIKLSEIKVGKWKNGGYYSIKSNRNFWIKGCRQKTTQEKEKLYPRGARFSISVNEEIILSDVYWANLNLNYYLKTQLHGAACIIDKIINAFLGRKTYKEKTPFHKLKIAHEIQEIISRYPAYLRKKILEILAIKKNFFLDELEIFFDLSGDKPKETALAEKAQILPNPHSRTGDIKISISTGLEKKKKYVVMEILPPYATKKILVLDEEEIPF